MVAVCRQIGRSPRKAQARILESDIVATFDVVHDAADPLDLLRSIQDSLTPDGIYVCLDMNCSDHLDGDETCLARQVGRAPVT